MSNTVGGEQTPIAVVDKDGMVWPWDSRVESDKVISAGSHFIYTKKELQKALKAGNGSNRQVETITDPEQVDITTKPKEVVPVDQKEVVSKILGV